MAKVADLFKTLINPIFNQCQPLTASCICAPGWLNFLFKHRMKKQDKIKPVKRVILTDDQILEEQKNLGLMLRVFRFKNFLSMDEVCADLNIAKCQLSKDENGLNNINYSRLVKYLRYYGAEIK